MIPNNETQIDQKRFIFAMIVSGFVIVVWQMFFAPELPPPEPIDDEAVVQDDGVDAEDRDPDAAERTETDPAESDESDQAKPSEPIEEIEPPKVVDPRQDVLTTPNFKITLDNRGARVRGVDMLKPEQYQEAGDLLGKFPEDSDHFPYAIGFVDKEVNVGDDAMFEVIEDKTDDSRVTYQYVDPRGRWVLDKSYSTVEGEQFQLKLEVSLTNQQVDGRIRDQMALDIFGFAHPDEESSFLDIRPNELESICRLIDDTEREIYDSIDEAIVYDEAPIVWAGVNKRYFVFSAVPEKNAEKCVFDVPTNDYLRTRIVQEAFSIEPGESYSMEYLVVIGPKDQDVLAAAGHKLTEAIDYGFFTFLAKPMRWALVNIYDFVGNWGFAIIILTILIRLLMWPINKRVYENSERMKEIQPILKEVREKYEDDQQRLAEETMKTFKENNVSALGCAPMFLQFPIFLALYFMILNSVELYQAEFALWYVDLSAPDPYFVLPIVMALVMYAQQSMMSMEGPNPQMQMVMKIMPLTFGVFMIFLPAGVVLYYSASMLLGIAQQFWIKRSFEKRREEAPSS